MDIEPPKDYVELEDIRIYPKGVKRHESWWTKIKRFFNVN